MVLEVDMVLEEVMVLGVDMVVALLLAGSLLATWWIGERGTGVAFLREGFDILTLKCVNYSVERFQCHLINSLNTSLHGKSYVILCCKVFEGFTVDNKLAKLA